MHGMSEAYASGSPTDDSQTDPKYGPMLAGKKDPQDRAFAVAVLSSTDPAFRSRERERALKRQQKDGKNP
jgi:hypothetical protein